MSKSRFPRQVSTRAGLSWALEEEHRGFVEGQRATIAPARDDGDDDFAPVYATPDGASVVASGLVFVRFAEGTRAEQRTDDLAGAGFEIVEVPGYARHAAWVRARSGGIGASLRGLAALEALEGVESVEPQMLRPRALR